MRYQLNDQDRRVKTIAIEEHFSTPMQRQKSRVTEFEAFYLSSRSEHVGHNIADQLADTLARDEMQGHVAQGCISAVWVREAHQGA